MTLTRKITLLPHILVVRACIRSSYRMRITARQIRDNEGYCNTRNGGPIACISCPFDLPRRTCRLHDRAGRLFVLRMAQLDSSCD